MNQPHRLLSSLSITKVGVSRRKGGFRAERTKVTGAGSLEAGLRTGYAEEKETLQDPGHCLSRIMASLPRVLRIRGFFLFGVTRS
ncbi:Uncharacterised protein [uncultured Clostridium sp.]|nr:Uncharacterised protein [uncultured Clostridium sp.]